MKICFSASLLTSLQIEVDVQSDDSSWYSSLNHCDVIFHSWLHLICDAQIHEGVHKNTAQDIQLDKSHLKW